MLFFYSFHRRFVPPAIRSTGEAGRGGLRGSPPQKFTALSFFENRSDFLRRGPHILELSLTAFAAVMPAIKSSPGHFCNRCREKKPVSAFRTRPNGALYNSCKT